ncbi:Acyl-homoserine lactone acylase PvdQ [Pandoraea horticolens]|uniref:Acyl-homoserine lactone acylase PvdQ n=1 Tax=Pandoraea horticolens TaxID=2508298 RepID=A0A5E4WGW9_9BURK|nr:penicillin acylase family protein [Pandoraea horticolens]VVE23403.1 Acyl-homoserine lactone acylase PvdQ [Pandoraea horticolens]
MTFRIKRSAGHRTILASPALGTLCLAVLGGCTADASHSPAVASHVESQRDRTRYRALIERTTDGVPHVVANDWGSLGWGTAYVQAQDDLCTMAQAFVTYRGERSRYFGAQGTQPTATTLGDVGNLDSDFFFRFVADDTRLQAYRAAQTPQFRELVEGFAAGYNRYLNDWQRNKTASSHAACRSEPWVTAITPEDVYRRLFAANLAGGMARFAGRVASAIPPDTPSSAPQRQSSGASIEKLALRAGEFEVGGGRGIGSNALAFGAQGSARSPDGKAAQSVLLGNPHWFLEGPDRFYQMRLTMPGQLDVSGASFLGVPVVMIGFNHNIAWTHTVSAARRFGLFQLSLAPDSDTTYLVDGKPVAMTPVAITVPVRETDGTVHPRMRTLYRTAMGPVVNLGAMSPALQWRAAAQGKPGQAFVIRDINADNYRVFANFLAWGRATSLDEFVKIARRDAATPWVNTVAIGRDDPRVWFGDVGAIPNVPDTLAERCIPPLGKAFAAQAPGVPFLDGARSACNWPSSPDAAQAGALPADAMPQMFRNDYVANMNNTHWIVNPAQPLTGFAAVTGREGTEMGLRPRLGFRLADQRIQGSDGLGAPGANADTVARAALDARSMSALLFKSQAVANACRADGGRQIVTVEAFEKAQIPAQARDVDIAPACAVLQRWDNTGGPFAQGAVLWDTWWAQIKSVPEDKRFAVPLDPQHPLDTPNTLNVDGKTLAKWLGVAVLRLREGGFTPDVETGSAMYAMRNGVRIPWFGGCDDEGYFASGCNRDARIEDGALKIDAHAFSNSYMQVVTFGASGGPVDARTLMAGSQSDDPASPHFADGTLRYSKQAWVARPLDAVSLQDGGQWLDSAQATPASLSDSAVAKTVAARWLTLAAQGVPAREASELLGTSEADLVATEQGSVIVPLRTGPDNLPAMLANLHRLGRLEVMVRTEQGIGERVIHSSKPLFDAAGKATNTLAMTVDASRWVSAYAVTRDYGPKREPYRQLQFFDAQGRNIAKITALDETHMTDYDALVASFRASADNVPPPISRAGAAASAAPVGSQPAVAKNQCRRVEHDGRRARLALADALDAAKANGWPVRIGVSNDGASLAQEGRIGNVHNIGGGWLRVQIREFTLHVRASGIAGRCDDRDGQYGQITLLDGRGAPSVSLMLAPQATAAQRQRWLALWRANATSALPAPQPQNNHKDNIARVARHERRAGRNPRKVA